MRPLGSMMKRKKENKLGTQLWQFTAAWGRHMLTDVYQLRWVSRPYRGIVAPAKYGFTIFNGFSTPTGRKTLYAYGLYNIVTFYFHKSGATARTGLWLTDIRSRVVF